MRALRIALALALAGCPSKPPTVPPELKAQRADAEQELRAATERRAAMAAEITAAEADQRAAREHVRDLEAREREAAAAVSRYDDAIASVQAVGPECRVEAARWVELHEDLAAFASEPRRDAAIVELERCRGVLAEARRRFHQDAQVGLREGFARALEEDFDARHPAAKGLLLARVSGDQLRVDLSGFTEWRPAECQRNVEAWCRATPHFRAIELHGPHGAFTCRPAGSPPEWVAATVRAEGLADPWVPVKPGARATPRAGDGLSEADAAELARWRGEEASTTRQLASATALHARAGHDQEIAEDRLGSLNRAPEAALERWSALETKKYRRMELTGLVLFIPTAPLIVVGLYGLLGRASIVNGRRDFSSLAERDRSLRRLTAAGIIGYAVGVPLLAAAFTLLFVSHRGKNRVRLTLSSDGVGFRF